MKKYRLTSNTIKYKGKTLYQIEALITIYPYDDEEDNLWDPPITNIGELGGYVESESNLSQAGKAWIKDNAKVFGNSRVLDNATVSGRAIVCDNAMILDNATISENAVVCEDATVENNSSVYGDAIVSGTSTISGNSYILDKSKICDSPIENSIIFDDAIIESSCIVNGHIGKHAHIQSYKDVISIFYFGFLKLNLTAYKTKSNVYIATESYPNHVRILESNDFLNFLYNFGKRILGKKFEVKNQNIIDILNNINSILKVSSDIEDKITFDFLMTVFLSFRELLEDKIYR
jgi:bacterial transferase hexapeptide repeat protein